MLSHVSVHNAPLSLDANVLVEHRGVREIGRRCRRIPKDFHGDIHADLVGFWLGLKCALVG